jgi:membrane protein
MDEIPGAEARSPAHIPAAGWLQIGRRVVREVRQDHLSLIAAGMAFFALLATFPALTLLVAIYGLLADPTTIQEQISVLRPLLPRNAFDLIADQLESLLASPTSTHGLGVVVGLLLLLWGSASGIQTLIKAVNLAYDEEETRSYFRLRALALALTLGALVFLLVSLSGLALLPTLLASLGLDDATTELLMMVRWPLLGVVFLGSLAVVYRLAPDRRAPKWRWVTLGSVAALIVWLAGSGLFSLYVRTFGRYSDTYGALGAAIVLLLWFYLSAFAILLGAEINAETEHQTAEDSTIGPDRPLGQRRAWMADSRPQHGGESEPVTLPKE